MRDSELRSFIVIRLEPARRQLSFHFRHFCHPESKVRHLFDTKYTLFDGNKPPQMPNIHLPRRKQFNTQLEL